MAAKSKTINMAGLDIICNRILTGQSKASQGNVSIADATVAGAINDKLNYAILAAATRTLTLAETGSKFYLNKADGITITLPVLSAAMLGTYYDFQVITSVTSNSYKLVTGTQGTDFINGTYTGIVGGTADIEFFTGNGTTHDNFTMAGTTQGGLVGTTLRIVATSATTWTIEGIVAGSGTLITSFTTT